MVRGDGGPATSAESRLREAPYGAWQSPISSDFAAASSGDISEVLPDGDNLYWLHMRPGENGRYVLMRRTPDGAILDVTPPANGPERFSVRTRVHEYGGGAYLLADDLIIFANEADQSLYSQRPGEPPRPIGTNPGLRYADGIFDAHRGRMIWVREDHRAPDAHPTNTIAVLGLDGAAAERVLLEGADFYSSPRLSPDNSSLAWLEWNHPDMPWTSSTLWVGRLDGDGSVVDRCKVAGGDGESIFQPEWSPDGKLYFTSDRNGWWNLYRMTGDIFDGDVQAVHPLDAEFGRPQWQFRMSTYAFLSDRTLVCSYMREGVAYLAAIDVDTLDVRTLGTSCTDISSLRAAGGSIYFRGASPRNLPALVRLDLSSGRETALFASAEMPAGISAANLSEPRTISFKSTGNAEVHGLYYPPINPAFVAPPGELPPLIVRVHGGPTTAALATLDWKVQFWTSRGFAIFDVNYGGSSGHGRAYRDRLQGQWGVVDVDDCVEGARHLADVKLVDGARMAIRGSSAGGYTTLCALTFRNVFRTGASHYGVGDMEVLVSETHKFESHYLNELIGVYSEEDRGLYRERSPLFFVDDLSVPVAFFQGEDDVIVPPSQTQIMTDALKSREIPHLHFLFSGEQHGFRRQDNIQRSLDAELYFYSIFLTGQALLF